MKTYFTHVSVLIMTLISFSNGQTQPDSQKVPAAQQARQPTTQPISNGAVVDMGGENSNAIKLERARQIYENIIHDAIPIDQFLRRDAADIINQLKKNTPSTQPAPAIRPTAANLDAAAPLKKRNPPTTKPAIASAPAATRPAGATIPPGGPSTTPAIAPAVVSDRVPVDARDLDRLALELRKEAVSVDEMMLSSSHGVVWLKPEVEKRLFHLARDLAGDSRTAAR